MPGLDDLDLDTSKEAAQDPSLNFFGFIGPYRFTLEFMVQCLGLQLRV